MPYDTWAASRPPLRIGGLATYRLPTPVLFRETRPLPAPVQYLKKVEKAPSKAEALRLLTPLATGPHLLPGEPAWPLGTLVPAPKSAVETGAL